MAKDGSSNDSNKLNKLKLSLINSIINAPTKEDIKQLLKSPILNDQNDNGSNSDSNESNSCKESGSNPMRIHKFTFALLYKLFLIAFILLTFVTLIIIIHLNLTFGDTALILTSFIGIIFSHFISMSYVLEKQSQLKKYIPDWRPLLDPFMLGLMPIIPDVITILPIIHYYKYILDIANFVIAIPGISVPIGAIAIIFIVIMTFGSFGYVEKYYLIGFIAKLKSAN